MINRALLIGNTGADPEIRYTQSGTAVANFNLATTEKWTDKDGQKQESTEWHRIVAWDRLAEICEKYLTKGSKVYIEGQIKTRKWQDKDGNNRYTTEIVAKEIKILSGWKEDQQGGGQEAPQGRGQQRQEPGNDVPF